MGPLLSRIDDHLPSVEEAFVPVGPMFSWDSKIPAWGMMLMIVGFLIWNFNSINDLDKRMVIREASATRGLAELQRLQSEWALLMQMKGDVTLVKELVTRIEKRLDSDANLRQGR